MPEKHNKILGQSNPAAATPTTLYSVPTGKEAEVSLLIACNQGEDMAQIRISLSAQGAADDPKQYIEYNRSLGAHESYTITGSLLPLAPTDLVRVYATTATVSFNAIGKED